MTLSTDQIIKTNVAISEIFTADVNARIINDIIHFEDKVVLLGQDNVIKCKHDNYQSFNFFSKIEICSCF